MTGRLWNDYTATPRQAILGSNQINIKRRRPTQADVLLALLRDARAQNAALELPAIMAAGIAQHSARFNELRARGFVIENQLDRDSRSVVRSRYRLRFDPEREGADAK